MKKFFTVIVLAAALAALTSCANPESQTNNANASEINAFNEVIRTFTVSDQKSLSPVSFSPDDLSFRDASSDDAEIIKSVRAEAYFIKFLLEDNYVIGKIDDCELRDGGECFQTRLQIRSASEEKRIVAVYNAVEVKSQDEYYIVFDIDYDFDKNALNSYTVSAVYCDNFAEYYRYDQKGLKVLSQESGDYAGFVAAITAEQAEFKKKPSDVQGHDYSASYSKAMDIAFSRTRQSSGAGVYTVNFDIPSDSNIVINSKTFGIFDTNKYREMTAHTAFSCVSDISDPSKWYTGERDALGQVSGTAPIIPNASGYTSDMLNGGINPGSGAAQDYSSFSDSVKTETFTYDVSGQTSSALSAYVFICTFDIQPRAGSGNLGTGTLSLDSFTLPQNNLYNFIISGNTGYTEINYKGEIITENVLVRIPENCTHEALTVYAYMNGEEINNAVYAQNNVMFSNEGTFAFHLSMSK